MSVADTCLNKYMASRVDYSRKCLYYYNKHAWNSINNSYYCTGNNLSMTQLTLEISSSYTFN